MKTFLPKIDNSAKKWHVIDATNIPVGKIATAAARILRGKHLPTFTPHLDTGEFVVIVNAKHAKLSGNKQEQKTYYTHSGYLGHLKVRYAKDLKMSQVLQHAIKGMLAKNKMKKEVFINRLKVFEGEEHTHTAQNPVPVTITF